VTTIGIVLVWHRCGQNQKGNGILPPLKVIEVHQRQADALCLLAGLRGAKLLQGVRGAPPADTRALAGLMVRLGRFAADFAEEIEEIDLNPVLVHPAGQGISVVDALIVRRNSKDANGRNAKLGGSLA